MTWKEEAERFLAVSDEAKRLWLCDLLFALTVFARDTYTVGGHGLDDPERMRRFNELMHRTATQLRNQFTGSPGLPNDLFFRMISEEVEALGFRVDDLMRRH